MTTKKNRILNSIVKQILNSIVGQIADLQEQVAQIEAKIENLQNAEESEY